MVAFKINPKTDGVLRVRVTNAAGTVVSDATVTAAIFAPTGKAIATNVGMSNAGDGNYDLNLESSWSVVSGAVREGEYVAVVTVVQGDSQATKRVKYLVVSED